MGNSKIALKKPIEIKTRLITNLHMKKISPEDFLKYAREDFKQGGDRGRVNAYGNLKKAMHAKMDLVLIHYGISLKNKNFPKKYELLRDLGFVAPTSLEKFNKIRNDLEHYYILPDEHNEEIYADLIELYLKHADHALNSGIEYSPKLKQHINDIQEQNIPAYEEQNTNISTKDDKKTPNTDFSRYPDMFIDNNMLNGLLVIGDDAPPAHVIAVTDIAMSIKFPQINSPEVAHDVRIDVGRAVLASEITDSTQTNIISVGNPDINPITAEIMGLEFGTKFELEKDTAIIKFYEAPTGKIALIILGYDDESIIAAAQVLANHQDYQLEGSEIIVKKL